MRKSPVDGCSPPVEPIQVFCLHCESVYSSDAMFHDGEYWRCGIESCNGIGFGVDVLDAGSPGVEKLIRSARRRRKGRRWRKSRRKDTHAKQRRGARKQNPR